MKYLFLMIITTIILFSGCSSSKYSNDAEKQVQELAEQKRNQLLFNEAEQALINQNFVLEGEQIISKRGRNSFVSSNTNFISLYNGKATVQVAFNGPYAGPNGIGGVTIEGAASNIKMKKTKKGNIIFSMNVTGIAISAQVDIELYKNGNEASATVNPNFNSNRFTLTGKIYDTENSNVFKGRTF